MVRPALHRLTLLVLHLSLVLAFSCSSQSQRTGVSMKTSSDSASQFSSPSSSPEQYAAHLSDAEYDVIVHKGTDRPGDGGYTNLFDEGVYHCRACGSALYKSETKFHSGCGWPSFETEIPGSVRRNIDKTYGMIRTEIVCAHCGGHLGHEFHGERITPANNRHCVNTSSIVFHPASTQTFYIINLPVDTVQFSLYNKRGVLFTSIGECAYGEETLQHSDAVEVKFNPALTSIEALYAAVASSQASPKPTILTPNSSAKTSTTLNMLHALSFRAFGSERQHQLLRASRAGKTR